MSKLTKETAGLGKVLNRLQLDKGDKSLFDNKIDPLIRNVKIIGNISTIETTRNVRLDETGALVFNLNNNESIDLILDMNDRVLSFEGGLEGQVYFVVLRNLAAHNVRFKQVRLPYGVIVGTTPHDGTRMGVTTFNVTLLGQEYYISNINKRVV